MSERGYPELIERAEDFTVPLAAPATSVPTPGGYAPPTAQTGAVDDFVVRAPTGTVDKTGMVVDPMMPNTPVDAGFAVTPDMGMYQRSAAQYRAPELQPANDRFSTPYYAAYTNDGDLAGAVMVGQGQGVRLVDNKTGEVVFQGTGPEAAQQAVGIANAVSEDRGRKAAWAIQADYGPEKGWVSQAAERYDPKKTGLLGTVADIALPVIGGIVAGPWGAAAGSALSSVAQGRNLKQTALGAALSGAGAYIAPGVANSVGGALAPAAAQGAVQAGTNAATQAAVQAGTNAAAQGTGTLLSELVVQGVRNAVPAALASSVGAGVGSVAGGALTRGQGGNLQGSSGTDTIQPTNLEEVVVEGFRKGLTPEQLLAMGIPAATIAAVAMSGAGTPPGAQPTEVEELTVEAPKTQPIDPLALAVLPGAVGGLEVLSPSVKPWEPNLIDKAVSEIKENPLDAAGLALVAGAPLFGNSGGGNGGSFAIPNGPGSRGSLSPIFSAQLPAATMGARTPRPVNIDTRYAIDRPEASFFSNVPEAVGPSRFAVPTPEQNRASGIGDLNADGLMDAVDLALFQKRFRGYADGGGVEGDGHGREDKIEALLSDGEYVIDAETVALLGNGSSKAGAKALDDFRVEVRREKGRDLAKGKISRDARPARQYLEVR